MFVLCLGFVLGTLLYRRWLFFACFLCFAFSHTPFHSLFISLYSICPFTRLFLLRRYLRTYSLFLGLLCFYSQRSDSKGVGCPHDDSLVLWGRQLGVLHFDPVLTPATWRERRPSSEGLSPARLLPTSHVGHKPRTPRPPALVPDSGLRFHSWLQRPVGPGNTQQSHEKLHGARSGRVLTAGVWGCTPLLERGCFTSPEVP